MPDDFYVLLNVARDASAEQIKAAYRVLSVETHPNIVSGPVAQRRYLRLQQAYDTLIDPERRAGYDRDLDVQRVRQWEMPRSAAGSMSGTFAPMHLFHSFATHRPDVDELAELMTRNFTGRGIPKSQKVSDLHLELVFTPDQLMAGAAVPLRIPVPRVCKACAGTGRAGYGTCGRCEGNGAAWVATPLDVVVPSNSRDGTTITVPLSPLGLKNLRLHVHVREGHAYA
jgi:molecular chaperone DnaJ